MPKGDESWNQIKRQAWERQSGKCQICGLHINLEDKDDYRLIGHHRINQSQGGKSVLENAIARHARCEALAHRIHRFGNPSHRQVFRAFAKEFLN